MAMILGSFSQYLPETIQEGIWYPGGGELTHIQ